MAKDCSIARIGRPGGVPRMEGAGSSVGRQSRGDSEVSEGDRAGEDGAAAPGSAEVGGRVPKNTCATRSNYTTRGLAGGSGPAENLT